MACQTKGTCSYDDGSKVRVLEQVQSDGPRQCSANERLLAICDYVSPGTWKATLGPGEEITVQTNGQPGSLANWSIAKTGFPAPISGCADFPTKKEGGVVTNTCLKFKFQQLVTYSDGSTVFTLRQVDVILNGTC